MHPGDGLCIGGLCREAFCPNHRSQHVNQTDPNKCALGPTWDGRYTRANEEGQIPERPHCRGRPTAFPHLRLWKREPLCWPSSSSCLEVCSDKQPEPAVKLSISTVCCVTDNLVVSSNDLESVCELEITTGPRHQLFVAGTRTVCDLSLAKIN